MTDTGDRVFQDGRAEVCPDCGGELQYQDRLNIICLDCDEWFGHYTMEDVDILVNEDNETVHSTKEGVVA